MPHKLLAATLLSLVGGSALAADERIAVYDLGSLDTLDSLALETHVVAVPKQSLPDYLKHFEANAYVDIGGLRSPDLDALAAVEPSLIVMTGRQNDWREAFERMADIHDAGLSGDTYLAGVEANVRRLAERLNAGERAEAALRELHDALEAARTSLSATAEVLVVTHNGGNLALNAHPVVHEVLGLAQPSLPEGVTSETRGERTFTPLSPEAIAQMSPEVVFVIDRSAAIGDEPVKLETLRQSLEEAGGADIRLAMLTPELWYLSGGGLESLRLQVEEVVAALASE
ncbi:ABC transporter substrate-binding protein [Billgrantia saliphila]|uniref:ABC transporter substrate-binding protein n=1 Tax=Billgrantia saliphila TaxID=1848458 RepID=UPI000CE3289B|nr:ABC transporter substrate-binding protein [Halomonas saliphila]